MAMVLKEGVDWSDPKLKWASVTKDLGDNELDWKKSVKNGLKKVSKKWIEKSQ